MQQKQSCDLGRCNRQCTKSTSPRNSVRGIFVALATQTLHVARLPAFAAARQGVRTQRRETLAAGFALAGLGGGVQPGATVAPVTGAGAAVGDKPADPCRTFTPATLQAMRAAGAVAEITTNLAAADLCAAFDTVRRLAG
jgi:hypothetical protein